MTASFDAPLPDDVLAAARGGGSRAQETIYRTYARDAYTLARRMAQCPDLAADIVQNAFLRAFGALHQYRAEAPFGHWLRRIVATEALMLLRSRRRLVELFAPEDIEDVAVAVEPATQLDLERVLALLPPLARSVLWLYHVEGYTHAEIAEACGKTPSFSKSQLARAHQRLRELLNPAAAPVTASAASALTITEAV